MSRAVRRLGVTRDRHDETTRHARRHTYEFADLRALLAAATPETLRRRAGRPRGLLRAGARRRQATLADLPLSTFLRELVVPYEDDEVTRLIIDGHDAEAFAPISSLTVGGLRDHLLRPETDTTALAPALTRRWSPRSAS